jgi:hypothetical protein
MAVKDKSNGAKHRGRFGKDGPIRAAGQAAAVAGTSGVLLLALKAAVLVSPTVLPHAAGAGLNALGIPNALSAIDDTSGALAGTADAPVVFEPASVSTPQAFGDTQPTVSRHSSSGETQTPGTTTGGSTGGTTGGDQNGGDSSGPGETEDPPGDGGSAHPPVGGGGGNPPGGGGGGSTTAPKGTVTNVVDSIGSALPPVKVVTDTVKPVTTVVDSVAEPVVKAAEPVVDTVVDTVKDVPVVGSTTKQLTDTLGLTESSSGGTSGGSLLGSVTGGLGGGLLG